MLHIEIDTLLNTWLSPAKPGAAVAVLHHDKLIHCQGYGLANLEWQQPITPDTIFGLGSLTKPFTATAIMLLEQQGRLHLDDPIQTYLPDYPEQAHPITLYHLLTHTSGIPNYVTQPTFWQHDSLLTNTPDEVIALFQDLPLEFTPGTRYSYSNSGYALLGRVLEKLQNMSYAEAIQQLIFAPLDMTHSSFLTPEAILPFRASAYKQNEEGDYHHARFMTTGTQYAAGGLGSTLNDLLRWDASLREETLLDHATQQRMYAPAQTVDGQRENYGLGWGVGQYRQHRFFCHAGGVPGYSAFYGRFPDDKLTIIILSNNGGFNATELARQICQLLLNPPTPTHAAVTLSTDQLQKMTGTYTSVFGDLEVTIAEHTLAINGWTTFTPVPIGPTSFYQSDDIEISFEKPDQHRHYTRLRINMPLFWFTSEKISAPLLT